MHSRAALPLSLSLICSALLFSACSEEPAAKPQAGGGGPPPGMPVEASMITAAPLLREAIALGSIISSESVSVSSEISGRIVKIGFDEGQPAKQGGLLFQLEDSIHQAELNEARANLTLAQRNSERALELFRKNLASARERDESAANLQFAQASVALAEARLGKTVIRAPFDGIAGLRKVSVGSYVNPGQAMVNLESINPLKVDFRVAEVAPPGLRVGMPLKVQVDAFPGEEFSAEVYAIDPLLDVANRSIGLRARLPNEELKLRPGLFAKVRLQVSRKAAAIMIPEQSIVPRGEQSFVYLLKDGKADMRPVKTGIRRSGQVEILEGVNDGDIVITAGVQKIGPGSAVMAINLPAAESPAPADDGNGADSAPQE